MRLLITDFETSGLDPDKHCILEIGAILCSTTLEIERKFEIKLKPFKGAEMDPEALNVNGYTKKRWKDALPFEEGFYKFWKLTEADMIFTAKNVPFDYSFYEAGIKHCKLKNRLHCNRMDIMSMAFPFLPSNMEHFGMRTISRTLKVKEEPEVHTAMNGALNAYKILRKILRHTKEL